MLKPRAYLIDSSIYIFRAWHIFEDSIIDKDGYPCNAVFGFSDFLFQLFQQKRPKHIACAFDGSQTDSYRREMFPEYKANREPAPAELKRQFQVCRQLCRAIGIPQYDSNRFEADDIVGTLAHLMRQQGFAVTIISADKDLTQLVIGEEDAWWDFARGTVLNGRGVEKHFGVRPEQIADLLALSGDKVDNIPGIPGIGYTTAAKLLKKFSNIESIIDNIEKISAMKFRGASRVEALVQAHQNLLPLNKKLTTIVTDMNITNNIVSPDDLLWQGVDHNAFINLSQQLNTSIIMQQRWLKMEHPDSCHKP